MVAVLDLILKNTETVIITIKSINKTSSVGSYGIPIKLIKGSLYVITFYLTCIINISIVTVIFSTAWKNAIVVSLLKSGDANDVSNFLPISLLAIFSKTLEKVVTNQLKQFLEANRTL